MGDSTKGRKRSDRSRQIDMLSNFSTDMGLHWTPGAGGNFLASLLYPKLFTSQASNEFKAFSHTKNYIASLGTTQIEFDSIDELIDQNKNMHYPIFGFHKLPVKFIESGQLDPFIKTKTFLSIDCTPNDVRFCTTLNFAKKYTYSAFKDLHYAFDVIRTLSQNCNWHPNNIENLYDYFQKTFVECFQTEKDIMHDFFEKFAPSYTVAGNQDHDEFHVSVTTGCLMFLSKCLSEKTHPTTPAFRTFIMNEIANQDDMLDLRSDNIQLDDSKTSLEIIRIPYQDFFFKSQFPESIQKFIPKIDSKKIKKYSMNNISLVESFTQNLQITRDYKIYIETAKEMISAI